MLFDQFLSHNSQITYLYCLSSWCSIPLGIFPSMIFRLIFKLDLDLKGRLSLFLLWNNASDGQEFRRLLVVLSSWWSYLGETVTFLAREYLSVTPNFLQLHRIRAAPFTSLACRAPSCRICVIILHTQLPFNFLVAWRCRPDGHWTITRRQNHLSLLLISCVMAARSGRRAPTWWIWGFFMNDICTFESPRCEHIHREVLWCLRRQLGRKSTFVCFHCSLLS